jgi:hypothetical protein
LREFTSRDSCTVGIGEEQVDVLRLPVVLHQVATEVSADRLKDVFQPGQVGVGEDRRRYFVTKTKWACSRKTQ